jgi:hypothetical protein
MNDSGGVGRGKPFADLRADFDLLPERDAAALNES